MGDEQLSTLLSLLKSLLLFLCVESEASGDKSTDATLYVYLGIEGFFKRRKLHFETIKDSKEMIQKSMV